jgi:Domain of unknown function (DUF4340)
MNRKTLTALAVLGILAVVTAVVLRQPQKGERVGERPRPIAKLAPGAFDTIAVTKAGVTTTIVKSGDKYNVTAPTKYPADENVAKQAFEALEKLEFGDTVSEQKSKHAEFELEDGKALRVVARKGEQVVTELLIGKSVGGNTLVRIPGKDEVWQGIGSFRYNFDRDTANWRDKTITKFAQGDAEKIDVKGKDGSHIVVKKEGEDKWSVVDSTVKLDKLDNTVPSGIVSLLSSWVTNDFADNAKPEASGLDAPNSTIAVSLKGGKTVTAMIGNKKGADDVYVKTADSPQVFLVKRYNVDRADKRPIDFRDKTLCDISDAELGEIAVAHEKDSYTLHKEADKGSQKGEWKSKKPANLALDPAKVTPLVSSFKDWKAIGYAEDQTLKANGLGKPRAVISARSKDGKKTCVLKVGDETKDKVNYTAQSGSAPEVYLVAKWSTDRLLAKPDDLKKK